MYDSVLIKPPRTNERLFAVVTALIAFSAYCCVYAYRKPFSIASFKGISFAGISYQTLLIISQVFGYMLSKFYGIRFISELRRFGRFANSLILVGTAWASLLCFALVPPPYGILFLFINGFSLGFLWGIIFSYLEGRKSTDFMGAVMAVSFIFAGGFTRSVAGWLMFRVGITERWMPFYTGLVFAVPLFVLLWMLDRIPDPTAGDRSERMIRMPMNSKARKNFLKKFGAGLVVITIAYLFLTVMRDIRDNYMSNIWVELGYGSDFSIFSKTESITSVLVLGIIGSLVAVKKNILAFSLAHLIVAIGLLVAGLSSLLFVLDYLNGALWMQLVGLGLYMGYIPFNCILFERLIAAFKISGNIGFLMYFADAFGYLGSVTVMLGKEFSGLHLNWSQFYSVGVIIFSTLALLGMIYSYFYFNNKHNVDSQ